MRPDDLDALFDRAERLLALHGRTEKLADLILVQSGTVELEPALGRSSADRFADFNAGAVGPGDLLMDDGEVWAHLRRRLS